MVEFQRVEVAKALPAGTNSIGKVTAEQTNPENLKVLSYFYDPVTPAWRVPVVDTSGRTYTLSDCEYAARHRTQIRESGFASNGTTDDIYTVPAGKVFYLTSATLSGSNTSTTSVSGVYLRWRTAVTFKNIIGLDFAASGTGWISQGHIAQSFPMPIKFEAGEIIAIYAAPNARGVACIQGWEETA